MPNPVRTAQGVLGGAAAGASFGGPVGGIIGGGLGLLGGLFGGDGGDEEAQRQAAWLRPYWDQVLSGSKAPQYVDAVGPGGLSPMDQLGFARARNESEQIASGREGAVRSDMASKGAGVATQGLESILRSKANQDAAGRANMGDLGVAAEAQGRRIENANAMNRFNQQNYQNYLTALNGAAGQADRGTNMAMYQGEKDQQNWQQLMNMGTQAGNTFKNAFRMGNDQNQYQDRSSWYDTNANLDSPFGGAEGT